MVAEEIQSASTVTYDFKGAVDYSMIKGLAAGQDDAYYESWFNDYIRVREIRDRMLGGHLVDEIVKAQIQAAYEQGWAEGQAAREGPPPEAAMPTTAYSGPDGAFNASVSTDTPPPQQPPPAVPQGAQRGIPDKGVVPGEFCGQCRQPAVFKAPFMSKANKQMSGQLACATCKNDKGFPLLVRWLNDDDPAWAVIRG